jgi:hypothetical protein
LTGKSVNRFVIPGAAELGGLALRGMVEAAGPGDGDVMVVVELDGAVDGSPRIGLAEAVEAIEDGAILAEVEALECVDLILLHLGGDSVGRRRGRRGTVVHWMAREAVPRCAARLDGDGGWASFKLDGVGAATSP